MDAFVIEQFAANFLIVLLAGLVAGVFCKCIGVSMLVGYLVIGALVGHGGLGYVAQNDHELEALANAGALLLLFAVGLEFSIEQLVRLRSYILLGGAMQMLLVIIPVGVLAWMLGFRWEASVLLGASASLSSTILVFKALNEWGQSASAHGRRAIAMLLFQDVALVPIMLFIPVLSGSANAELLTKITNLFVVATLFVAAVYVLRKFIARKLVPLLISLRSTELVVLFAVIVLTGACWLASLLQMPAAVGALAAGFMLSGNRLTHQIDTLVLPFRETFSAVFFVTLGALLEPNVFLAEPLTISVTLVAVILIKALAAGFALKLTGLRWRQAMGTGLGLSQLGEFSFLIVGVGVAQGVFTQDDYQRTLVIAIGTLVLTPQLIKFGLRWGHLRSDDGEVESDEFGSLVNSNRAVVIGVGLIGGKTAARLETLGVEVCLVDRSPLNLYPFAQQGFQTVTGDAMDDRVIERVCPVNSQIAVVSVPDDSNAIQIVARLRTANPSLFILVRCRYFSNMSELKKAGANQVVSEERETSVVVTQICERLLWQSSDEPERGM